MNAPIRTARGRVVAAAFAAALVGVAAFGLGRCTASPSSPPAETSSEDWTCAMHPQVRASEPGACPICGMDLVPVGALGDDALAPNQVALGARARALAGIRTAPVVAGVTGGEALRLAGRVEVDERTERTVTSWIGGRIDRLHARVTGQRIRRGQTLATVYSPEVYAAARDLRASARQLERLSGGTALARTAAESTLASARERLSLLGIPDAEITRMQTRDAATRRVAIRSPFAGTVLERLATEGAYVTPGAPLYRLADLSTVWVQLDAYERDLPRLRVGQAVTVEVEGVEGALDGTVAFVDPVIDPRRRTARVRVEVANEDGALRPGMLAEAVVRAGSGEGLTVPASAPLFTGRRSIVYVELPDRATPTYEARTVRLGARAGDRYAVLEGLEAGERVVVHGAFALDADLAIRGGVSMMERAPAPDVDAAAFGTGVERYLEAQRALAADDLEAARGAAEAMVAATASDPELARRLSDAETLSTADDLDAARRAFEPLGAALAELLRAVGNPVDRALRIAHCPMAFDNRGAEWIQAGDVIDNAYFGPAMRTCGSFRETFAPGAAAPADAPAEDPPAAPASSAPASSAPASSAPASSAPATLRRGRAARPRSAQPAPAAAAGHEDHSGHSGHDHGARK